MDLLHSQKRAKGSHAENTNKFIVEVRATAGRVDRGREGRITCTEVFGGRGEPLQRLPWRGWRSERGRPIMRGAVFPSVCVLRPARVSIDWGGPC